MLKCLTCNKCLTNSYFYFRYADILAGKLQQKVTSVEKMQATRKLLKEKIETFKADKATLQPLIGKLTDQTKFLQDDVSLGYTHTQSNFLFEMINKIFNFIFLFQIENDISKRYKNRPVNLMGGISLF